MLPTRGAPTLQNWGKQPVKLDSEESQTTNEQKENPDVPQGHDDPSRDIADSDGYWKDCVYKNTLLSQNQDSVDK